MSTRLITIVLGVLLAVFAPAALLNGCRASAAQAEANVQRERADALVADTSALGVSLRRTVAAVDRQNAAVADLEALGAAQRARLDAAEAQAVTLRRIGEGDIQRILMETVPAAGAPCDAAVSYLGARAADLALDW